MRVFMEGTDQEILEAAMTIVIAAGVEIKE